MIPWMAAAALALAGPMAARAAPGDPPPPEWPLPSAQATEDDPREKGWSLPTTVALGLGYGKWEYGERFERQGSPTYSIKEHLVGIGGELTLRYDRPNWNTWLHSEVDVMQPWFHVSGELGICATVGRRGTGSFRAGLELYYSFLSSYHKVEPMNGEVRYADVIWVPGAHFSVDYRVGHVRMEIAAGFRPYQVSGTRRYNDGIPPEQPGTKPRLQWPIRQAFAMTGDILMEYGLGDAVHVGLHLRGEVQGYRQSAQYETGFWQSWVSWFSMNTRLMIGRRF